MFRLKSINFPGATFCALEDKTAGVSPKVIEECCRLDGEGLQLLKMAMVERDLSARAYDRILKVSRTIADLDRSENIQSQHISEAIQCRTLDRQLWV